MVERKPHRLDGKYDKLKTKNCNKDCPHYESIFIPGRDESHPCYMSGDEEEISEERCYVGVAWKKISQTDKPRKCQYV